MLIEAEPGKPVRTELIAYQGAQPLADLRLTLAQIEEEQLHLRSLGWLRVTIPLEKGDPDLARKIRARLPNALVIHADIPEALRFTPLRPPVGANARDHYCAYLKQLRGQIEPPPELLQTFNTLYESARGDGDAPGPTVA